MVNWADIHKDFGKYSLYQQWWEQNNFTYQDAQEWIKVGLIPEDYELASHLKQNNITPEQYKNKTSQNLLDLIYSNKTQVETIYSKYLKSNQLGELIIADYPNLKEIYELNIPNLTKITINNCPQLERTSIDKFTNLQQLILNNLPELKEIYCFCTNLTTLEINNCDNLESIICWSNKLTQIKLSQGEKLAELNLSNNNLNQDLSFLKDLANLTWLDLNNNHLHGSLEYLKEMSKLEWLDISGTDIDSGWEYLPESVKNFYCSADKRLENKVKVIEQELEPYGGTIKGWRQAQKRDQQIQLLQNQQSQFQKQETQINYLELRVQELTQLIKQQKQKIIQDFLNILPEKELIQQLITTYLEFKKAESQGIPSRKLKKECQRIEDELEEKLGEEFVEKIQLILKDCENLVNWELELEERLKGKTFLISEQRKIFQITDSSEEKAIIEKHEATHQKQLKRRNTVQQLEIALVVATSKLEVKDQEITRMNQTINQAISTPRLSIEGSINVNQGNALIDNTIGDNANIASHYEEISEEFEAKIQQAETYGTPGSSNTNN